MVVPADDSKEDSVVLRMRVRSWHELVESSASAVQHMSEAHFIIRNGAGLDRN